MQDVKEADIRRVGFTTSRSGRNLSEKTGTTKERVKWRNIVHTTVISVKGYVTLKEKHCSHNSNLCQGIRDAEGETLFTQQ